MTAYLIAHLRVRIQVPYIKFIGIYSESASRLTHDMRNEYLFDVHSAEGNTFEEAKLNLLKEINHDPYYHWVKHLIPVSFQ